MIECTFVYGVRNFLYDVELKCQNNRLARGYIERYNMMTRGLNKGGPVNESNQLKLVTLN